MVPRRLSGRSKKQHIISVPWETLQASIDAHAAALFFLMLTLMGSPKTEDESDTDLMNENWLLAALNELQIVPRIGI